MTDVLQNLDRKEAADRATLPPADPHLTTQSVVESVGWVERSETHRFPLTVQVGAIGVSIQSALHSALEDLRELYAGFPPCRGEPLVRLRARREGRSLLGRRRYAVYGDEQRIFTRLSAGEVLPHLEWAINWRVVARAEAYIQIHAATLIRECSGRPPGRPSDGRAVLLVGKSGSGKSTLAAGLLARGWTYYGDEIALIDPQTLRVHPYPKPVCLKAGSFQLIRELGLPLWRRRHYARAVKGPVGYVRPPAALESELLPRAVGLVIFPEYRPGSEPQLRPMPRGEAAFELARCQVNRGVFSSRGAQCLCALARSADCWRLRSGPINSTLDLLEGLVRHDQSHVVQRGAL